MFAWFRKIMRSSLPVVAGAPGEVYLHPKRCPLNVPGPFYTMGDCMACEAPETEAPELLAPLIGGNTTTYFVKQPNTPEEVENACCAIQVCCVNDLRYGGTDPAIIQRLNNSSSTSDFIIQNGHVILSKDAEKRHHLGGFPRDAESSS